MLFFNLKLKNGVKYMLKKLSFIFITTFLIASEMPPMPPIMMGKDVVKKDVKKEKNNTQKKVSSLPKECEALPPMVVFLPPPMESDLIKCKNEIHKPSKEKTIKSLKILFNNKNLKVNSINNLDGFKELYKININIAKNNKDLYCNSDLTNCFEINKFVTTKTTKGKK
jgi:hypothetical protein